MAPYSFLLLLPEVNTIQPELVSTTPMNIFILLDTRFCKKDNNKKNPQKCFEGFKHLYKWFLLYVSYILTFSNIILLRSSIA